MLDITASIVLFKSNPQEVKQAIDSFLNTSLNVRLFLVDNSPTDDLRALSSDPRVEYIANLKNIGFGAAHNIALKNALGDSRYHLVLNPDISFPANTLEPIKRYMDENPEVGLLLPKILYPDGSLQRLCKLLPKPSDLFLRRFMKSASQDADYLYEMHFADYNKRFEAPFLSGCFMFLRTEKLNETGMFDENIFLYWEDLDLSRRFFQVARNMYFPDVVVYHGYKRGAHHNYKLLLLSIKSLVYYFNKWGWFDNERKKINKRIIDLHTQSKSGL